MAEEEIPKFRNALPAIRTMRSDAALYAEASKTSFISAAAAELKRRSELLSSARRPEHHGLRILILAGVLIIIALGIGIYFYYLRPSSEEKPQVFLPPPSLVAVDDERIVKIKNPSNLALAAEIQKELSVQLRDRNFRRIILVKDADEEENVFGAEEFIQISLPAMPVRLKNIVSEATIGALKIGDTVHPFLIFKVSSFPEAFAGTLAWEKDLLKSFQALFKSPARSGPANSLFHDQIIKNQDARALGENGQTLLIWTIFNRKLLIITQSKEALAEIIARYKMFPPR